MTALDRYDRLEAMGSLRSGEDVLAQEVVVKFGNATLVILTPDDTPITHWSLAAIRVLDERPATTLYVADEDHAEILTIEDEEMRDALRTIMLRASSIDPEPASKTSLRWVKGILLFLVLSALVVVAAQHWLKPNAYRLISPEYAQVLSQDMLDRVEARTGPRCTTPWGTSALDLLVSKLDLGANAKAHVLDLGDKPVISLPSQTILLNRGLIETATGPEELLGWIAVGGAGSRPEHVLRGMFDQSGSGQTLHFLVEGELDQSLIEDTISHLFAAQNRLEPEVEQRVTELLVSARISGEPLAEGLRREGVSTSFTTWSNPDASGAQLINDQQWRAIESICRG
jgi:hypothetical protein